LGINEGHERVKMKKPSQGGRGMLSTMPKMIYRPALMKVSEAKANRQTDKARQPGGNQDKGVKS
jgi:hypothetical protein